MELLAPAGNFDALRAAVAYGADAVYLGGEKYGARAAAGNFDTESLPDAIRFAHLHGVKVYLTLNTLLKDSELDGAIEQAQYAFRHGVDAFIVQDLGMIARLRKTLPNAVLHASTQMGICNAYGAQFVKEIGCSRVVVARETLPEDIAAIYEKTGLEIEMFCQGALCVAYSGNCYYSSLVSGCSGNRGRCLQLCRKKYSVGKRSGYYLSAQDICLVDKIKQLKNWGVHSLKIEGRMRSPEYVAETVSVYRAAIDGKTDAHGKYRLQKVFNRGDYCAAYTADPTETVIYPKVQNHIGVAVGTVSAVKNGKAVLALRQLLQKGDGVKYLRNGYEVGGGTVDGSITGFQGDVRAGDEVRLTTQASLKNAVQAVDTRIPATIVVRLDTATGACLTLSARGESVTVQGQGNVETAVNKSLTTEDVRRAVGTLGGTSFAATQCTVHLADTVFYSVGNIKDMRKRGVAALENALLSKLPEKTHVPPFRFPAVRWFDCKENALFVKVSASTILQKLRFDYDHIILDPADYGDMDLLQNECRALDGKALLHLPVISRGKDVDILQRLKQLPIAGVVANNVSQIVQFSEIPMVGGIGLNKLNCVLGGTWIDSVESDGNIGGIRYAYGKPPLMHVAHCPKRTQGGTCTNCSGYTISLQDEKGAVLTFRRIKEKYCYGVLIPQLPINTIDRGHGRRLLDLTYADDKEINAVNAQMHGAPYSLPCMRVNAGRKLQ